MIVIMLLLLEDCYNALHSKLNLQEGAGLGRTGQGMSTALKVERLGKNAGVIVNEHEQGLRGRLCFLTTS